MRLPLHVRPETTAVAGLVLLLGVHPARALPADPQISVGWYHTGTPIPAGALADGAGADLAGALFLPEADLDGAVLAWANLADAVLRQVSLRGVRLEGADLTRADFTGARLDQDLGQFQALLRDTLDPQGQLRQGPDAPSPEPGEAPPDPPPAAVPGDTARSAPSNRKADLSHFFGRNLPLGAIRELALEDLGSRPKRLLVMDGAIGWSSVRSNQLVYVNSRGLSRVFLSAEPIDLGWLSADQAVWYTSDGGTRINVLPVPMPDRHEGLFAAFGRSWTLPPGGACASPGSVVRAHDGMFWRLRQDGSVDTFLLRPPNWVFQGRLALQGERLEGLVAGAGSRVLGLAGDRIGLLAHTPPSADLYPAPGARHLCLGRKEAIWCALPGEKAIRCFDTTGSHGPKAKTNQVRFSAWSLEAAKIQVLDLAEGPNGDLWFTSAGHNAIGRIESQTGALTWFPLPLPDSMPARIVYGNDGRMYFTELGGKRIGAITAVDPGAGWTEPPVPARKPPLRRWKKKRTAPAPRTDATTLARALPGPEPPPVSPSADRPPAPERTGTEAGPPPAIQPPAPARAAPAPDRDYLAALRQEGVAAVKWNHIEAEHHFGAGNGKGQFTRSRSNHPAVAELIYHCLTDPVCDPILSSDGNWLAMRRFNHVIGYYWDTRPPRRWRPTGNLVVVVSPDQETVLTAYPVREF